MQRVARGDRVALEHLHAQMKQPLYAFLRRMGASRDDAADLLQTVFLKLWQHRAQYAGTQANAWVYRITHNAWLDYARKWRLLDTTTPAATGDIATHSPEESVMAGELGARLQQALATLPHDTREAILLSRFSPLTLADIAGILGTSEANIKVRIHRGLMTLRRCIEEEGHD